MAEMTEAMELLMDPMEEDLEFEEEPEEYDTWAAKPADELISELQDRENEYFDYLEAAGYTSCWRAIRREYYGLDDGDVLGTGLAHELSTEGEDGEHLRFRVNEFRSHIRQSIAMSTKDRPNFRAVAYQDSYAAGAQIATAENVVRYLYETEYGERKERQAMERAELFAIAYTWLQWDPDGGDDIEIPTTVDALDPMTGGLIQQHVLQPGKTGNVSMRALSPYEVVKDISLQDGEENEWIVVREKRSRAEIIARYPDMADDIRNSKETDDRGTMLWEDEFTTVAHRNNDRVIVKHFYRIRSAAMPEGRHVIFVGDVVLEDLPLRYPGLPVVDLPMAEMIGSALGYSDSWDLLPLSQMLTELTSDLATAVSTYGRPTLIIEKGTEIDMQALVDGNYSLVIPRGGTPPAYIQPPTVNEGSKFMVELVMKFFQGISGLNEVARGNPGSNIKSGNFAALMHAVSMEFQDAKHAALELHRERVANLIIDIMKSFAEHPFVVELAGPGETYHAKTFTSEAFTGIRRIRIQTDNPMLRTRAGQMEFANYVKEIPGAVETPQQALEIFTTGRITPLTKATESKLARLRWENETLLKAGTPGPDGQPISLIEEKPAMGPDGSPVIGPDGQPTMDATVPAIPVLPTDDPYLHIPEHLSVLDSPEAVHNPELRKALFAHLKEHQQMYMQLNPVLAGILKIPPPMAAVPELAGGAQEAPAGPPPPPEGLAAPEGEEQVGDTATSLPRPAEPPPQSGL